MPKSRLDADVVGGGLVAAQALPEEEAVARFRAVRWRHGAFCPHCGSSQVYHFSDNRTHKCGECRQRFSIKVGTIFEDSKIGLASWFLAVWLVTETPLGITAPELARRIGVSQKTATHMIKRLRQAAQTSSFSRPLEVVGIATDRPSPIRGAARVFGSYPVGEAPSDQQSHQIGEVVV